MLLIIPLGNKPLKFNDGVTFTFPTDICCNCGTSTGLSLVQQDSRCDKAGLGSFTEFTFRLTLPFCAPCAPSGKRRSVRVAERGLVAVGVFGAAAACFLLLPESLQGNSTVQQLILPFAGVVAAAVTVAWVALTRPHGEQSSYFQPVRLLQVKGELLSGSVKAIHFAFTNEDYRRAFEAVNSEAIERRAIEAKSA